MQNIHKVCLILTGISVVILCVGIGIGIGKSIGSGKNDSNDTFEYEAFDEDYAEYPDTGSVIDVFQPNEVGKKVIRSQIWSSKPIKNFVFNYVFVKYL